VKCTVGDGSSCLALAYAAARRDARRLYGQACVLGAAIGCTNYAATIWAGQASDAQLACARRTFEKACSVNEPFGCGMVGRLMLESTDSPSYAEGRRYLEKSCDRVGGFSCRVLAKHLESGKLGPYRPEAMPALLTRACATGDRDACGEHATAAETFPPS
jgi:TPR repeat protein